MEELHFNLLADLTKHYSSKMDTYNTFLLSLRTYLDPVSIKESQHLKDIFDALERKGHLAIGKYDVLIKLFDGIDERVVTLIKNCEDEMQILESKERKEIKNGGKINSVDLVHIWRDISADLIFQFKTNKISTTDALQIFTLDEFKKELIYPDIHAVFECSVDNNKSMVLRAASPLFYTACCAQEKLKTILHKVLDNPCQQIRMIAWLDADITMNVEIVYKKGDLTVHTENVVKSFENKFCDCLQWLKKEVRLQDLKDSLINNGVIDEEILKTVNGIDDLVEFLLNNPEKQNTFKAALCEAGYHGIVKILNGENVIDLISEKAYKVYMSILNNYNSIRELDVRVLKDSSSQLKEVIENLPLENMDLLLKDIRGKVNVLHSFILALNNASHSSVYESVLDTIKKECQKDDKRLCDSIKEGVLKEFMVKVLIPRGEISPSISNRRLGYVYEMRIKQNYSRLLHFSMMSIRNKLVNEGVISPLTKYLVEYEPKSKIKTDMVLKSLLRSEKQKFESFMNILREGTDELKEMTIILEKDTEKKILEDNLEDTESKTKHLDDLKASLEKSSIRAYPIEKMEMNFLHPFLEEEIISVDEHDRVFYDTIERKHKHLIELIVSKADHACKKQKWIEKYEDFAKASYGNVSVSERVKSGNLYLQILKANGEEMRNTKEASNYGEIVLTFQGEQSLECASKEADSSTGRLHTNASDVHCVIDEIIPGSIKVLLRSPSPLFYRRLKSACESGDIKKLLLSIIQACMKEDCSSLTLTACVEIKISYVGGDCDTKVEPIKTADTLATQKLRDCRNILVNEICFIDIVLALCSCNIIDHETLIQIMHSKTENREKMEEVLSYIEKKPTEFDVYSRFIEALQSSGYKGIANILNGSYGKHLNSIPGFKVRMCILDIYQTLIDEINLDELKNVSVQLHEVIEKIQRQSLNKEENALHLFLKEILLGNTFILRAFIDSLCNHTKYHHILKKLEDTSFMYQGVEKELTQDAFYTYNAKIQITKKAESDKERGSTPTESAPQSDDCIMNQRSENTSAGKLDNVTITPDHSNTIPVKVDKYRKRIYRVGLNLFNKNPDKGLQFLSEHGFIDESPIVVAKYLITRKGLSKQVIGEYLSNLQDEFNMEVLHYFADYIDLSGLQIDMALRKFQLYIIMPREKQKIEILIEAFAQRYCYCNPDQTEHFKNPDTIVLLAFAIITLNKDLHDESIKKERNIKLEDFIKNLRGIDDGENVNRDLLIGIYDRTKAEEFRLGVDHVMQVRKVDRVIVGKKPFSTLALPHRRLVCYCRLFEVHDPKKKEKPGLHQREVFVFNDIIVITKIFSKKKTGITYSYKTSFPLTDMQIFLFETSAYHFGVRFSRRTDNKVLKTFNARNDHDRQKFVEDLEEAILESQEMEQLKIKEELHLDSSTHNTEEIHHDTDNTREPMYEQMKPSDLAVNTLSAPEFGGLKKFPLSKSLNDLYKGLQPNLSQIYPKAQSLLALSQHVCTAQGMKKFSSVESFDSGVSNVMEGGFHRDSSMYNMIESYYAVDDLLEAQWMKKCSSIGSFDSGVASVGSHLSLLSKASSFSSVASGNQVGVRPREKVPNSSLENTLPDLSEVEKNQTQSNIDFLSQS